METKVYIGKVFFSIDSNMEENKKKLWFELKQFVKEITNSDSFDYIKESLGKPILIEPSGWHFSLSHKSDVGVFALSNISVGIDIEEVSINRDLKGIADEFFTPIEVQYLKPKDIDFFYHIWSRKEACIKEKGVSVWDMSNIPPLHTDKENMATFEVQLNDKKYSLSVYIKEGSRVNVSFSGILESTLPRFLYHEISM